MEFKHFRLHDVKADDAARTIEGWASTFGNVDSDDDVIVQGAFTKSLNAQMPKMLWQHNQTQPIGVWHTAQETDQGLFMKGEILPTTLGNDVYTLAKAGAIDSMSIGYGTKDFSMDRSTGVRTLKQVDLWEVSLVTFPANDQALITGVKSKPENERDLEKCLRDAGFSRTEAKAIVSGGYKAIAPRDAEANALITLFNQFTS
ncbi:HK97 family phage prohead protease [soil metagenome]